MEENNILANVEENKEETVDSKQDLYSKVGQAFYEELHSIIKGKIFVKIEERTDLNRGERRKRGCLRKESRGKALHAGGA